jgi:hypothetical protein
MPWYWLFGFMILVAGVIGGTTVTNWLFLLMIVAVVMAVVGYRMAD